MSYKTELHCHSATVSRCASAEPEAIVEKYLEKGYSSLVLTEHCSRFTFKNKKNGDRSALPWNEKIDFFMSGVRALERAAAGRMNIIQGCEIRLNTDDNDYQIYGDSEEFLRAYPDIMDVDIAALSERVREAGLLLVQAHPFRNAMRVVKPELLDGVEVYNGSTSHDSRNDIAFMWAERHGLIKTSGSDYHNVELGLISGGIVTDEPIRTNSELLDILRTGRYTMLGDPAVLPTELVGSGGQ